MVTTHKMLKLFNILPVVAAAMAIGITGSDNVNVLHLINILTFEAAIGLQCCNNGPDSLLKSYSFRGSKTYLRCFWIQGQEATCRHEVESLRQPTIQETLSQDSLQLA
jgi:hypothetical protein